MPRQARLDVPGALHHIIVRGINKAPIFKDDQDKTRFLERLGENVLWGQCTVHAWVLMTNHVYLLFKSGRAGISAVMRKQLTWYAQYFNRRHGRTGHLFENRYKSILCDEETSYPVYSFKPHSRKDHPDHGRAGPVPIGRSSVHYR